MKTKNKKVSAFISDKTATVIVFFAILIGVLFIPAITQADTENHDVTLTISSVAPEITYVSLPGTYTPTAGSVTATYVEVHVRDNNTISDIQNVTLTFFKSGQTNRSDDSCSYIGDLGSNVANYTCSANMDFYDGDGSWEAHIFANDTQSNTAKNSSWTMTYNQLHDMNISVSSIAFGSINPSASDQKATNDPEVLQNIGNVAITSVNVTGHDVEEAGGHSITAQNFTVGQNDDCATSGVTMLNATSLAITGVSVATGSAVTDDMYYCIPSVPVGLNTGAYSDVQNWIVTSIG